MTQSGRIKRRAAMPLKVQSELAGGRIGQGSVIAGDERADTASVQRERAGQFQIRREITPDCPGKPAMNPD